MRIYFAHPVSAYDTPYERRVLNALATIGYTVFNPNTADVKCTIAAIRKNGPEETASARVMEYFFDEVRRSDALCFSAFADGKIGAGVAGEIKAASLAGLPIYEIKDEQPIRLLLTKDFPALRFLSIDETRARLKTLRAQSLVL